MLECYLAPSASQQEAKVQWILNKKATINFLNDFQEEDSKEV